MNLEYIMTIDLIKEIEKGRMIMGGADSKYSIDNMKGLYLVDQEIIIQASNIQYRFKVKDVTITTSIANQINVAYILYDSENFFELKQGDKVYRISQE